MKTNFKKVQKGTSLSIPIVHWSLLYTQTRGTTTMYNKHPTLEYFLIEYRDLVLIK